MFEPQPSRRELLASTLGGVAAVGVGQIAEARRAHNGPAVVPWRLSPDTDGSRRVEPADPSYAPYPGGFNLVASDSGLYAADTGLFSKFTTRGETRWSLDPVGPPYLIRVHEQNERVLVASVTESGDELRAYSVGDGRRQWHLETEAPIRDILLEGNVWTYVATDDGIRAQFTESGGEAWKSHIGDATALDERTVDLGGVSADPRNLIVSDGLTLYALGVEDGAARWSTGMAVTSAAVSENTVYAGLGSDVVALSAEDGTERWRTSMTEDSTGVPVFTAEPPFWYDDGTSIVPGAPEPKRPPLYASPDASEFARLNHDTGAVRWHLDLQTLILDFRWEPTTGTTFVVTGEDVIAVGPAGERGWTYRGPGVYSRLVQGPETSYVVSGGSVAAIDTQSGTVGWELELGESDRFRGSTVARWGERGLCVEWQGELFGIDAESAPSFTSEIRGPAPNESVFQGPPGGERYGWTIGEESFEGRRVTRTFVQPGEYDVRLVVDWPTGLRTTRSRTVTVPEPTPTPTRSPTPTPTPSATMSPSPTRRSPESASTDASGSGFGIVGALAALGSLAALRNRRQDETES